MSVKNVARILGVLALMGSAASCVSFQKIALDAVGDTLSAEGSGTVFTGDNDPQLVADALPFAIKAEESLQAANPTHRGLARTVGSLYVMYASAFVAGPAEFLGDEKFAEKQAAQARAVNLALRGRNFELTALELAHPGFRKAWDSRDPAQVRSWIPRLTADDVGALYWMAAGHLSAFSLTPLDMDLTARVPLVLDLVGRAYDLNPHYHGAALDELLVSVLASVPPEMGGDPVRALVHYDLALKKTGGRSSGAYLARATALDLPHQDRAHFIEMLQKVLALDPAADPSSTLATLLDQKKAAWYLSRLDDLFVE